jgi:hypothetical protein
MKIYKCDRCGREIVESYWDDVFEDEGWTTAWYDEYGFPIQWEYDEKTGSHYTYHPVTIKHFCPACYYRSDI